MAKGWRKVGGRWVKTSSRSNSRKRGRKTARANPRKPSKYEYLHVLQGNYGYGWEDLTASESFKEVRQSLREYRENEGGRYRIIKRREPRAVANGRKRARGRGRRSR